MEYRLYDYSGSRKNQIPEAAVCMFLSTFFLTIAANFTKEMQEYIGEFSALLVAVFWTVTALAFERASLRIGSLSLNVIRLFIGLFFLSIFVWIRTGMPFPTGATQFNWVWLTISGLVGFVFGDLFLFKSYSMIGSRFAMLIRPQLQDGSHWVNGLHP